MKNNPELEIQIQIVNYLETLKLQNKVGYFTAFANETFTKSWKQKRKNKLSGVRSGTPDLLIGVYGTPYFVELKTEVGTLQKTQKNFLKYFNSNGISYSFICTSLKEFKLLIDDLINQRESKDSEYLKANMKGSRLFKKYTQNQ